MWSEKYRNSTPPDPSITWILLFSGALPSSGILQIYQFENSVRDGQEPNLGKVMSVEILTTSPESQGIAEIVYAKPLFRTSKLDGNIRNVELMPTREENLHLRLGCTGR